MTNDINIDIPRTDTATRDKILWLSLIQGWAILLVVIGHVNGFTYSDNTPGEFYPLSHWIHKFCYSFHMPLFMFVSGGLLYYSRIGKGWKSLALYKDKFKRLLIPYIALTVLAFFIKAPLASLSKNGMDISIYGFFNSFFDPATGPLKEMWFIGTLIWLMMAYPIYKSALKSGYTEIILLTLTLIPLVFDLHIHVEGFLNISGVADYAFYFVGGMLFFKYNLIEIFKQHSAAVVATCAIYIILFLAPAVPDWILACMGILMSFSLAALCAREWPRLFSSFRDHSFQIFLVGIFPQMFVELIFWKRIHHECLQIPFYIVSCTLALASGVVIARLLQNSKSNFLRRCFGVK